MYTLRFDLRAPGATAEQRAALYRAAVDMAAWADTRGCAAVIVSEHHASDDGYLPAPLTLAAAMAAVTTTVPISVAAALLPLYDPARLAEEMIVLDHLSRGRAMFVLGIGYRPEEYALFDVDFDRRGAIADEKLAALLGHLRGESALTPAPFTPRGPMLAWGGSSRVAARRAGRNGLGFFAQGTAPGLEEAYMAAATEAGHEPGLCLIPDPTTPLSVFVNDDVDAGWDEVGACLLADAIAYADWNDGLASAATTASLSTARTVDALRAENGSHRVVTVDEAVELVGTYGMLGLQPLCGGLDPEIAWTYVRRVVDDVLPTSDPGANTVRPLPQLTPMNEWFWTAGADGRLRIQRCDDCQTYVHPPAPLCPACRSRAWTATPVSGEGTVVAFTVNRHAWLPGFDPPYAIANVALDEDPSVHLTTNIVGGDPDEVQIGQRVRVTFEQHEDVWLPLFERTGEVDPVDRVPAPARPVPRPPASPERFEHRSVLSGVGRSRFGRRLMIDPLSLTMDACLAAVADAGLTLDDIDGLSTYPGPAPVGMSEGGVTAVEEALRLQPTWINGGGELPGPGGAVIAAMLAVSAGLCRHVLCFRTVWESTNAALGLFPGGARVSGPNAEWRAPFGAMSAAHWIGMNANHYLHRYRAPREMLGWIALNGRTNAARNPAAIYRDPMTMDDYLSARPITTPFGLYDCDVPCDGSIAVVVSDAAVAGDLPRPAVHVEAVGTQITERISWDQDTLTHEPQVIGQSAHLWTRTDLRPADIDLALLYDGFTFNAISWLEALGFCEFGEAKDWLDGGRRIALDGDLPVNPHGGQLSEGRTHGFGFLFEAVTQLRHDAGERQVAGARTAVVTSGGGTPSSALLLTRDPR